MPVLAAAVPADGATGNPTPGGAWRPMLAPRLAAQAWEVACVVAERMRNRASLIALNQQATRQSKFRDTLHWSPLSLAHGDTGMALVCAQIERCCPGRGWAARSDEYLAHAFDACRRGPAQDGLFGGIAGLAFAARQRDRCAAGGPAWLPALEAELCRRALTAAARLHARHGVAAQEIDLISGASGMLAALLDPEIAPPADVACSALLDAIEALVEPQAGVARWHTPGPLMGDRTMAESHPQGVLNYGLAHGIPGPLAATALALAGGCAGAGARAAAHTMADDLLSRRIADEYGINWPTVVPLPLADTHRRESGSRAAWCYGAPGVARALWLAGVALDREDLRDAAVEAMLAVYRRPPERRMIPSPTFCHGVAGLLQVTLRFAHDTGIPDFFEAADALCLELLAHFHEDHPLGFRSIEPGGNAVDHPGVLDGAAGIALVLFAASSYQAPDWDRAWVLS